MARKKILSLLVVIGVGLSNATLVMAESGAEVSTPTSADTKAPDAYESLKAE